jgi:uncharacterized RDD family membrane protein YckC
MKGYMSEEHKRRFTIITVMLAALFFIAQFILPYIIVFAYMPSKMFNSCWTRYIRIENSALWQGKVWYVEESPGESATKAKNNLMVLQVGSKEGPVAKIEIPIEDPLLLADKDKLWIISSSAISYYNGEELKSIPNTKQLDNIYSPFLCQGRPAVIEITSEKLNLFVFNGSDWIKERILISNIHDSLYPGRKIKIISQDKEIYSFLKFRGTLYYRQGLPSDKEKDLKSWKPVCSVGINCHPTFINKKPAVFRSSGKKGYVEELEGMRLSNGIWEEFFSHRMYFTEYPSIHSIDTNKFILLTQTVPASFKAIEVKNGKILKQINYGKNSSSPTAIMKKMYLLYIMIIFMPLLFALILSVLMQKYRIVEYKEKGISVRFASLGKRGFAQAIDCTIVWAPWIISFAAMTLNPLSFEKIFVMSEQESILRLAWISIGCLLWAFLWLFIFSFTEGKYGKTPGKWLLGIKVLGIDLKPCGFWRALIRNLLEIADAFFNFMVGIMLIALSDNWQRIGDSLAKTIVVEDREFFGE